MLKVVVLFLACIGMAQGQVESRIVGGSKPSSGQFPFIVSLRTLSDFHTCGGSLIRNDLVLTAAHCVTNPMSRPHSVVAGITQLNAKDGVRATISKITPHAHFILLQGNDIALIHLESKIESSPLISTIPLETQNIDTVRDAVVIGWGATSYPGASSNDLQFLNTKTITVSTCRSKKPGNRISDRQVCTLTQKGQGACSGDSGGPLVVYNERSPTLIGVTSYGTPCARGDPDVFTRVSSYVSWVNNNS